MQYGALVVLLLSLTVTEGFFFNKNTCPIKKYSGSKHITGDPLLINKDFEDRVKDIEKVAKDCKVHVFIKGSYYQLASPAQFVPSSDGDLTIGHGFKFEVRDESNGLLCNKLCLSRNPMDMTEVKCFLQGATRHGLKWSQYNSDVLSDGTYASSKDNTNLKTDIQTKCQNKGFKRALLRQLRQMYEENEEEDSKGANSDDDDDDDDDEKK